MNVGVAHSEVNPNTRVMNSRGIWLTYALGVGILHIVLLSIPFFSVPVVWTLTNVIHNFVSSSSSFSHCRRRVIEGVRSKVFEVRFQIRREGEIDGLVFACACFSYAPFLGCRMSDRQWLFNSSCVSVKADI